MIVFHPYLFIVKRTCFPHFQSGPRITLAPTPSIINLVVRIPDAPPLGCEVDADVAPPIAPPSKLKLSNPKVPPTDVPDMDKLLVVGGTIELSPAAWLPDESPPVADITFVVVVRGRVGGAAGTGTERCAVVRFEVVVMREFCCIL